jgi:hypothetical protein
MECETWQVSGEAVAKEEKEINIEEANKGKLRCYVDS